MAIGKLFLTTLAASLISTSAMAQASAGDSVTGPFVPGDNYIKMIVNFTNWYGGLLDSDDKKIYKQALLLMLDNVPAGTTVDWYSQTNQGIQGQMRVVYGYQTTNGYCRVYQSEVNKVGVVKSFQEYACRSEDNPRWTFYNK